MQWNGMDARQRSLIYSTLPTIESSDFLWEKNVLDCAGMLQWANVIRSLKLDHSTFFKNFDRKNQERWCNRKELIADNNGSFHFNFNSLHRLFQAKKKNEMHAEKLKNFTLSLLGAFRFVAENHRNKPNSLRFVNWDNHKNIVDTFRIILIVS